MKEVAIKDICEKGSSALKQKELLPEGKYPVYGASGIAGYLDSYQQENEYIGIVKDGSGIGRVAFYPEKTSLIGTMQYILPKKGYNIRYIGYCLQSLDLSKYKQGAAIPHIYFSDYGNRVVKVTNDVQEQNSIVERIDVVFARINGLKANAERQLAEARALYNRSLTDEMIPKEGWTMTTVRDLSILITKGASPKWQGNSYVDSGGILFVTSENVREGYLDINPPKYVDTSFNLKQRRSILKKDDVLVNIVGASIGRAAVFNLDVDNANINQAVCLVRFNKEKLLPKFLCLFLNSEMASKQYLLMVKDAARANLSLENIGDLKIGLPSITTQQSIVSRLDALYAKVRQLEIAQRKTLTECDALKQAILREVFE